MSQKHMKNSLHIHVLSLILAVASATPAVSKASEIEVPAPTVKVERVGTHIYYRYSMTQISREDQKAVLDTSVQLLKNELQEEIPQVTGIRTLANTMMSEGNIDRITAEAQKSVDFADTHSMRGLLPTAILLYGGLNTTLGFGPNGGLSGDLGLVIYPQKVIEVDTTTGASKTYIDIDHSLVFVPHAHIGIGAGAELSYSVGAMAIFGDMTKAADFRGFSLSAGADLKLMLGVDFQVAAVHNTKTSQTFIVAGPEFDVGAEANASFDGEGAYVWSLDDVGALLDKKPQPAGPVQTPPAPTATHHILISIQ